MTSLLEELGGAMSHASKSGVATFVSADEKACLDDVRFLLGFLPSNNLDEPPQSDTGDDPDRLCPELRDLTQVLQLVRLGRTALVLPESVRANLSDGLAVVPLTDAARVTTVIAWPPHCTSTAVAGLVRTAARL